MVRCHLFYKILRHLQVLFFFRFLSRWSARRLLSEQMAKLCSVWSPWYCFGKRRGICSYLASFSSFVVVGGWLVGCVLLPKDIHASTHKISSKCMKLGPFQKKLQKPWGLRDGRRSGVPPKITGEQMPEKKSEIPVFGVFAWVICPVFNFFCIL